MFLIEKMMQYKHKGGFSCSLGWCFHSQETYECCSFDEYVKNEIMCVPKGSDGCSDIYVCTNLICNDECCSDSDTVCCDDDSYNNCAKNEYWCDPIDCSGTD